MFQIASNNGPVTARNGPAILLWYLFSINSIAFEEDNRVNILKPTFSHKDKAHKVLNLIDINVRDRSPLPYPRPATRSPVASQHTKTDIPLTVSLFVVGPLACEDFCLALVL